MLMITSSPAADSARLGFCQRVGLRPQGHMTGSGCHRSDLSERPFETSDGKSTT
jgi:hypothetical protein